MSQNIEDMRPLWIPLKQFEELQWLMQHLVAEEVLCNNLVLWVFI